MVFHWSLSESKSPQVSGTLLSILSVLNNVVIWMVNNRPIISMSSSPFNDPSVTVPRAPITRISLNLSRHFSLSFNASGRSSELHPVCSHSCWMYVRVGRSAFARPYVGVHRSTSLMSSSLLLQQCPPYLVRLTWIVFVMGGRWPYSWQLHKNVASNSEQVLVATPYKAPTIRPPASHHENYPS